MSDNNKPTMREESAWAKVPLAFRDWWISDYSDEGNPFRLNSSAYWAWAGWSEAMRTQPLTDEQIKRIMLDNGFTIKEGLTDLKPYVYAAARALIAAATGVNND